MNAPIHPIISRVKTLLGAKLGCYDMHRLLFEYAQGTLAPDLKLAMDEHLKDCKPCLDYLDTYRATIKVTRQCCPREVALPPELRAKLEEFIAANL
jgi:anti-sigma factor (TIGR02949 family)